MRQFQICYENKDDFLNWLDKIKNVYSSKPYNDILFYITWIKSTEAILGVVTESIEKVFPNAIFYGNEASGSIADGHLLYGINISCHLFASESSKTELVWVEEGSELSTLDDLWNYCNQKTGLRAIELIPSISYLEVLKIDNNVPKVPEDIHIFGGASVNYSDATFSADIIAKGHEKTREGMAVVLYYGDDISIYQAEIIGWKGLGELMEVTNSTGKTIKEIDHKPAYSIYEKYLDLSVEDSDSLVFPLIMEEDGNEYIRTPQIINEDKSMLMFADVPTGSKVRIAYGDKNIILQNLNDEAAKLAQFKPEAIKAFSCAARRLFWTNNEISKETKILQEIAPVCGFYTGGEILRFGKKLKVLNQTLAVIAMRETGASEIEKQISFEKPSHDTSLISRLIHFSETVVEKERGLRLLAEGLENAFASQYLVLYYLDIENGTATFLHGDEEARKFIPISDFKSLDNLSYGFSKEYIDKAVVEEDRERVKSIINPENMYNTLKNHSKLSVNYRTRRSLTDEPVYLEMSIIKAGETNGVLTSAILAFRQTDEELVDALALNEKLQHEIMDEMLGDEGLFLIDCKNDKRETLHDKLHGNSEYKDRDRFSKTFSKYIENCVADVDKEMMRKYTSPEYLLESVKDQNSVTVQYLDVSTGVQRFYEMKLRRFSNTEVLQSFVEKDKEIIDRMILDRVKDDYFAMVAVNFDTGLVKVQKNSKFMNLGKIGEVYKYSEILDSLSPLFLSSDDKFFTRLSDIEFLKERFKDTDKATHVFKAEIDNETKWVNATCRILTRHIDDTPFVFILGFYFLDSDAAALQESRLKVIEQREELEKARRVAEEANEAKTRFLFSMSHDIRTPMNAISGFTAMAKKYSEDKEKVSDYLDKIEMSSRQLLTLINQVLEMSRIEKYEIKRKKKNASKREYKLNGKKVLLVDDNEVNLELTQEILEESGLIVEIAEDGQLALDMIKEKGIDYYDFVLMDIQMPVMDGYQATRAIRALYPDSDIPIIALSENAYEEDVDASLQAGMNDHIAKPINVPELFRTLSNFF